MLQWLNPSVSYFINSASGHLISFVSIDNASLTFYLECMHIGRVLSYLCNYLAKKEVTADNVVEGLEAAEKWFADKPEKTATAVVSRAISAAIAGRTFSTQAAWWDNI